MKTSRRKEEEQEKQHLDVHNAMLTYISKNTSSSKIKKPTVSFVDVTKKKQKRYKSKQNTIYSRNAYLLNKTAFNDFFQLMYNLVNIQSSVLNILVDFDKHFVLLQNMFYSRS
jgi:hypothetical protein